MYLRPHSAQKKNKKDHKDALTLALYEDYEAIWSATIDEKFLQDLIGRQNLDEIEYLNIQIDSATQSILELPDLLPKLKHLVLDNSSISSIRDLGVGLRHIWSISLSGCGLYDLDGIGVLTGLKEINLSDNYIADVTPLALHENIETINLTGNKIADLSFGDALASCPKLRSLFLSRNPIEKLSTYRALVSYLISSLEMLDGLPLDPSLALKVTHGTILEASSTLQVMLEDNEEEDRFDNELAEELLSSKQPKIEPTPTLMNSTELIPDTGSELTHGSAVVLAGNVALAIRKRRQGGGLGGTGSVSSSLRQSEEKDFESALEVLDGAHRGGGGGGNTILREGDITESVTGSIGGIGMLTPSRSHKITTLSLEDVTDSPTIRERRPKSALPPYSKPSTPDKNFSPRQKNSSRPQSAAAPATASGSGTFSLPSSFLLLDQAEGEGEKVGEKKEKRGESDKNLGSRSSSLVHLDIVKRNKRADFLTSIMEDRGEGGAEGGEEGEEEIAVTHKERLSMMSAQTSTHTSLLKMRSNVLMKLRGSDVQGPVERRGEEGKRSVRETGKISNASKVGSALGFNLAGSLAAIDQWVADMSSEEEEEEEEGQEGVADAEAEEEGETGYEQIDGKVERESRGETEDDAESLYSPRSRLGLGKKEKKILTREDIFQMCVDSSSGSSSNVSTGKKRQTVEESQPLPPIPISHLPAEPKQSTDREPKRAPKSGESKVDKALLFQKLSKHSFTAQQLSDQELVELLRQPPKVVPQLKTKTSFQQFFGGMSRGHFERLVCCAYENIADEQDREGKIQKRMELMTGLLV